MLSLFLTPFFQGFIAINAMAGEFHHVCKREAMLIRNMLEEVCTWPLIQCMALRAPGILAAVLKRSAVVVVVVAALSRCGGSGCVM